ncbi:MAG: hypothetical protein A2096_03760 [Spirochaetes bacterium GWF1_41_5]|nr:MAG: hypothetical protein A2096_03760 [Spirochaetes bacterium GWF1_41_5]HBE04662.1 hypothetical protein [Spirochaetia bacterium]
MSRLFFLLFLSLLYSADPVIDEFEILKKEYADLEKKYWQKKEDMLKGRSLLNDKLTLADEALRLGYMKKNNLLEELYLVKENARKQQEAQEEAETGMASFRTRISEIIEDEKRKVQGFFPSEINQAILELNNISRKLAGRTDEAVNSLIAYKLALIKESEKTAVYTQKVGNDEKPGKILRIGFISGLYDGEKSVAMLIRNTGLSGIFYSWLEKIPDQIAGRIKQAVQKGVNSTGKKILISIPTDPAMAGTRLKSLQGSGGLSVFDTAFSWFLSGGNIMYPLLLITIAALIIMGERIYFFSVNHRDTDQVLEQCLYLIKNNNKAEALRLCHESNSAAMRIVRPVLEENDFTRETAEQLVNEMIIREVPILEKRLSTLAVFAAIAPLLGLLGTVNGMIILFDVITIYGTSNPKILAGGISIALVTTQAGLYIAIPILFVHHLLSRKKNSIITAIEKHALAVLNHFYPDK